jgi:hypothetical protein
VLERPRASASVSPPVPRRVRSGRAASVALDSYNPPVDWIRGKRLPLALAAGVLYIVLLPVAGWHWAQPILLAAAALVLYWLPGLDTVVRNFRAGYSERR